MLTAARIRRLLRIVGRSDVGLLGATATTAVAITLEVVSPHTRTQIVRSTSTNLANLQRRPLRSLLTSAIVQPQMSGVFIAAPLLVALAGAQHHAGRQASFGYAVVGHVGATLIIAGVQRVGMKSGVLPKAIAFVPDDVGSSYALYGALGGFVSARPPSTSTIMMRWGIGAWLLGDVVWRQSYTAVGHLLAYGLGFSAGQLHKVIKTRMPKTITPQHRPRPDAHQH